MKNIRPLYFASSFFVLMYAAGLYGGNSPLVFPVLLGVLGISQFILTLPIIPTNRFINLFEIIATASVAIYLVYTVVSQATWLYLNIILAIIPVSFFMSIFFTLDILTSGKKD